MPKILLADESPVVVQFFCKLLPGTRPDLEVVTAKTTDDVLLKTLCDDEIALVVLDAEFGTEPASTVLSRLVAMRPDLPIILTTAEPMDLAESGVAGGLITVLAKPFSSERFVRVIHHRLPRCSAPNRVVKARDRSELIRRQVFDLLVGLQAVKRSLAEADLPDEAVGKVVDEQVAPLIGIASELSQNMLRPGRSRRMGR